MKDTPTLMKSAEFSSRLCDFSGDFFFLGIDDMLE